METGISPIIKGMILLWSGAADAIPAGWHLCDGDAGTPNLQDRFIVGAGDTYAVGATGGVDQTSIGISDSGHNHNVDPPIEVNMDAAGSGYDVWTGGTSVSDTGVADIYTDSEFYDNKPLYYSLAYIMKL